jgi:hypothetical protein
MIFATTLPAGMGAICVPGEKLSIPSLSIRDSQVFNTTTVHQRDSSKPVKATQSIQQRLYHQMRKASPIRTVGNGTLRRKMNYAAVSRWPSASPWMTSIFLALKSITSALTCGWRRPIASDLSATWSRTLAIQRQRQAPSTLSQRQRRHLRLHQS